MWSSVWKDAIQKQMIGFNNLIRPYYAPKLYIEEVDGQQIIVLWATGGNERPTITGPVQYQLQKAIEFFKTNILQEKIIKHPDRAEATRIWNYPVSALEEILSNSLYHRSYELREPVEIRIFPNQLTVISYGGPDRSLKPENFKTGIIRTRRYRNRKLGDFFKELDLTEGKGTGVPRIRKSLQQNGSPEPVFDFDDTYSYFAVDLFVHEAFEVKKVDEPFLPYPSSAAMSLVPDDPSRYLMTAGSFSTNRTAILPRAGSSLSRRLGKRPWLRVLVILPISIACLLYSAFGISGCNFANNSLAVLGRLKKPATKSACNCFALPGIP